MRSNKNIFPPLKECVYTSCYCEENIWKLCEKMNEKNGNLDETFVVFITSSGRATPIFCQKVRPSHDMPVLWDYHVVIVGKQESFYVFDFDTTLPVPSPFKFYLENAIRSEEHFNPECKRIIPASEYLSSFSSDRSHMKNDKGEYLSEPPNYPPIMVGGSQSNFQSFISLDKNVGLGFLTDYHGFIEHFALSLGFNNQL